MSSAGEEWVREGQSGERAVGPSELARVRPEAKKKRKKKKNHVQNNLTFQQALETHSIFFSMGVLKMDLLDSPAAMMTASSSTSKKCP